MATTFEVLAEPNRRRILDLLVVTQRPVGDLVEIMGMSQPAVSKHLRVLRDAGLVECRTDAQRRVYRVRPEPFAEVDRWLAPYRLCGPSPQRTGRSGTEKVNRVPVVRLPGA